MSIPVFIDLAIADQTLELRSYLKSLGAAISEENANEGGLQKDLKEIIRASPVCWKEISNEADIEMIFSGIISLIMVIPIDEAEEIVNLFAEEMSKVPPSERKGSLRIRLLSNVFHGLDDSTSLRYVVYYSMLRLAKQSDLLHLVPTDLNKIKYWVSKWKLSIQKTQSLLHLVHDAFLEAKMSENATKVMIELLGTYTEDNASQAREDAHRCIVTCLADPGTFLMDHLLALKPVKFLEGELIHDLLTIFVSGKLSQYEQFYQNNQDFIDSLGLSHEQNRQKMQKLTFMQMAETRRELDFATIQQEMMIEADEVEDFIINVLRTKAVCAKIDQIQKKVLVSSTIHRTFGRQQWQMLRQVLLHWQSNLEQVSTNLASLAIIQASSTHQ